MFLIFLFFILIIALIPLLINDDKLHNIAIKYNLSNKTNYDEIISELDKNSHLIKKHESKILSGNQVDKYFFIRPVDMVFDLHSDLIYYSSYKTEKQEVRIITVVQMNDNMECIITTNYSRESVFIFNTHKLNFKIRE